MNLIGITGEKFNGKDTVGKWLVEKHGYVRFAFADVLKEACRIIFHFDDDQLYGDKKEIVDDFWLTTPREIFQFVGTDLFRNKMAEVIPHVEKNIWIMSVCKKIEKYKKENPDCKIVITDVRFKNEVDIVKKMGGTMWRIERVCDDEHKFATHESEKHIKELVVDNVLKNDSTVEDLYKKIDSILSKP